MVSAHFIVLVEEDPEYHGAGSWWKKGQYQADSAVEAVEMAYADVYLSPGRAAGPAARTDRVAVVGPGQPWVEFTVKLKSKPATYIIEQARAKTNAA